MARDPEHGGIAGGGRERRDRYRRYKSGREKEKAEKPGKPGNIRYDCFRALIGREAMIKIHYLLLV